jgi:hypothetical protein
MHRYFLSIRAFPLLLAALMAMLLGSGCGDSAESASLSKPEFVRRADALCIKAINQFQREYNDLMRKKEGVGIKQLPSELIDIVIPIYSNLGDEIESLGTPTGGEQKVEAFLDSLDERLDYARENPSKFVNTLHPFAETPKLAEAYGLNGCGKSFG